VHHNFIKCPYDYGESFLGLWIPPAEGEHFGPDHEFTLVPQHSDEARYINKKSAETYHYLKRTALNEMLKRKSYEQQWTGDVMKGKPAAMLLAQVVDEKAIAKFDEIDKEFIPLSWFHSQEEAVQWTAAFVYLEQADRAKSPSGFRWTNAMIWVSSVKVSKSMEIPTGQNWWDYMEILIQWVEDNWSSAKVRKYVSHMGGHLLDLMITELYVRSGTPVKHYRVVYNGHYVQMMKAKFDRKMMPKTHKLLENHGVFASDKYGDIMEILGAFLWILKKPKQLWSIVMEAWMTDCAAFGYTQDSIIKFMATR
jgi:hypothetical protein